MMFLFALMMALAACGSTKMSSSNWAEFSGKHRFVKVFAPWCGHCKNMAEAWEQVAMLWDGSDEVVIGSWDGTEDQPPSEWGVTGYPTILYFPAGSDELEKYPGKRDASALSTWLLAKSGVQATGKIPVDTAKPEAESYGPTLEEFEALLDSDKPMIVAFTAPWCGHCKNLKPTWRKLMEEFEDREDVRVIEVNADAQKELAARYQIRGFPTIRYVPGKKQIVTQPEDKMQYQGPRDADSLRTWIEQIIRIPDDLGRLEVYDAFAAAYACADTEEDRAAIARVMQYTKPAEEHELVLRALYTKVIERFGQSDLEFDDFITQETANAQKAVQAATQQTDMIMLVATHNILRAFVCPTA